MATDSILVVDDDPQILKLLLDGFTHHGFHVFTAGDGASALEIAKNDGCSVAIVDLYMPGLSGQETINRLKEIDPHIEVIVFTGNPSLESSIEAIHSQVFDYVCKPALISEMVRTVNRAAERRKLIIENRELVHQLEAERNRFKQEVTAAKRVIERQVEKSNLLVGESDAIRNIRHSVAQVAPSGMTVLLLGESGTGKDVVARLIHESSGRDPATFVKINCPAIPETLLESELFGHEVGAFTGAERRKPGRFEIASGGTIFLDEIAALPLSLQSKLLQVIEDKHFTRLGSNETIEVDVRIIAATNAPVEKMVAEERFRADVFYRLNEYTIEIPPLRKRLEDIPLLAEHFHDLYATRYGHPELKISPDTLSLFAEYQWPGNVREMESLIRRMALEGSDRLAPKTLKTATLSKASPRAVVDDVRQAEVDAILHALSQTRWNRRKAAQLLKMSYSSLLRRINKYDLKSL